MGAWDDAGPELALAQGGAGGGTLANSQDDEYRSGSIKEGDMALHNPSTSWIHGYKQQQQYCSVSVPGSSL